jgi:methionyl-tRNA synthetase
VRSIWDLAKADVANEARWSLLKDDLGRAAVVTRTAVGLVRIAALVAEPFVPSTASLALSLLGETERPSWPGDAASALAVRSDVLIARPAPLVRKIDAEWAETQRKRFSGAVDA